MAERQAAVKTVYHVVDGPVSMYLVDAKHALTHKNEWKDRPWKDAEVEAYKRRKAKEAKGEQPDEAPAAEDEAPAEE